MSDQDEIPPPVGVYWIREDDYPAALAVFADGHKLPRAWSEWLKMAEEMESGLKAYGHPVLRVAIDPAAFPDWCTAHATTPGSDGRKRFVAAGLKERYGEQK